MIRTRSRVIDKVYIDHFTCALELELKSVVRFVWVFKWDTRENVGKSKFPIEYYKRENYEEEEWLFWFRQIIVLHISIFPYFIFSLVSLTFSTKLFSSFAIWLFLSPLSLLWFLLGSCISCSSSFLGGSRILYKFWLSR